MYESYRAIADNTISWGTGINNWSAKNQGGDGSRLGFAKVANKHRPPVTIWRTPEACQACLDARRLRGSCVSARSAVLFTQRRWMIESICVTDLSAIPRSAGIQTRRERRDIGRPLFVRCKIQRALHLQVS